MVRPKKSASASRINGAKAKNKGKAKQTVPVLDFGYDERAGGYEVFTVDRAKLPKGYVAYESELSAQQLCIRESRCAPSDDAKKMTIAEQMRMSEAVEEQSMQMATDSKDWDVGKKMSELSKITKGSKTSFVFKPPTTEQPCRRSRRAPRSR